MTAFAIGTSTPPQRTASSAWSESGTALSRSPQITTVGGGVSRGAGRYAPSAVRCCRSTGCPRRAKSSSRIAITRSSSRSARPLRAILSRRSGGFAATHSSTESATVIPKPAATSTSASSST
jgi:hypothetical protein